MRDFDDGGGGDDADSEALGDGQFEAVLGREVDVQEEGFVAGFAENGDAEVVDRGGEVLGYGLEGAAEGVHVGVWGMGFDRSGKVGCAVRLRWC